MVTDMDEDKQLRDGGELPTGDRMLNIYLDNFYFDKPFARRPVRNYLSRRVAESASLLRKATEEDKVYDPSRYVAIFCIGGTGRRYMEISRVALQEQGFKLYPVQLIEGPYDEGRKKRPIILRKRDLTELRVLRPKLGIFVDKNTRTGVTLKNAAYEIFYKNNIIGIKKLLAHVMIDGAGATTTHVDHYKTTRSDIGCTNRMVGLRRFMEQATRGLENDSLPPEAFELFHDGKYPGTELDLDPDWFRHEPSGVGSWTPATTVYRLMEDAKEKVA